MWQVCLFLLLFYLLIYYYYTTNFVFIAYMFEINQSISYCSRALS